MPTKIVRNLLTGFLAIAINVAVGFLLMPLIVHSIGLTGFGIWMLVNTVVGYLGLLDIGLSPTLVKKSAELLAKNDDQGLNKTVSMFFILYLLIGVIVGIAVGGLSFLAPQIFSVPEESIDDFRTVFLILGFQVAASFPMSIWVSLLAGAQAYHIQNGISILIALTKAAGTVLLLQSNYGLVSLIWLGFAMASIGWLIAMLSVRRRIPHLRVKLARFEMRPIRSIAHFSGVMFIGGISWKTLFESARIIIGLFQSVASVTIYEVGLSICLYSRSLFYVTSVIMPSAAHLEATGDKAGLRRLYLIGTKYLLAAYLATVVLLVLLGRDLVALWMGTGFEESIWILYVLLIGSLFQSQNLVANYMLTGMGHLQVLKKASIAHTFLVLTLSMLFVFYWGLIGAAWATTVTIVLVETYFLRRVVNIFGVSVLSLFRICHLPAFLPAAAGAAFTYFVGHFVALNTWSGIGLCVLLYSVIWFLFFLLFVVTNEEKAKFKTTSLTNLGGLLKFERR